MNKTEFLKNCADDLATHERKEFFGEVLEWVEFALQFYPITVQIDSQKTIEGAYKAIEKFARDNHKQVLTPKTATQIIVDYLNIKQPATRLIALEDFL